MLKARFFTQHLSALLTPCTQRARRAVLIATLGCGALGANGQTLVTIGIDFLGGTATTPVSALPVQTIAGVLTQNQRSWNTAAGASGISSSLLTSGGVAATGVTLDYSAAFAGADAAVANTPGNLSLMRGYLDSGAGTTSVTIGGLTLGVYDVYVYTAGAGNDTAARFSIGSQTLYARDASTFSGAFARSSLDTDPGALAAMPAGNYLIFSALSSGTFTLTATGLYSADGTLAAPINALQVVQQKDVLYWDMNNAVVGAGNSPGGTWNDDNANWTRNPSGVDPSEPWKQSGVAVFSAGSDATAGYTVTVVGERRLNALLVQEGSPTFAGEGTLRFNDLTPDFNVAGGATATARVGITGTNGLTKGGDGTLVFDTTPKTYTGPTHINAGTLFVTTNEQIPNTSDLALATGATLRLDWGRTETIGALSGSGAIDLRTGELITDIAADTTFSGAIGDTAGTLRKSGTGNLTLDGNSTFSGRTLIDAGVITARSSTALGTSSSGNVIADGAALRLSGGVTLTETDIALSGAGPDGTGAIRSVSGGNTLNANLTLPADATLGIDSGAGLILNGDVGIGSGRAFTIANAGTAVVTGTVNSNAGRITVDGAGSTLFTGAINGNATEFVKTGAGTTTFSGSSANTYGGATRLNDGTLQFNKSPGTAATNGGAIFVGDGIGNAGTATLRLLADNQIPDYTSNLAIAADGRLDLNNHRDAVNVLSGAGEIAFGNTGHLVVGINSGSSTFGGIASGTGIFEQTGAGSLTFTNDFVFNGELRLGGGTLALNGFDVTVEMFHITGNATLDFGAGSSSIFNAANFTIDAGVTLTVTNWTDAVDYFYAQNWTGASFDTTGSTPTTQVVFTNGGATRWQSFDKQITPVPEPSTYGAIFLSLAAAGYVWRRRRPVP